MDNSTKTQLEQMIDSNSVKDLLHAIAIICQEKADHINENWQDKELARLWKYDANRIENFTKYIHN